MAGYSGAVLKPFRNVERETICSVPPNALNSTKNTRIMSTTSGWNRKTKNTAIRHSIPSIRSRYLGEPPLVFAEGRHDVDPKLRFSRLIGDMREIGDWEPLTNLKYCT